MSSQSHTCEKPDCAFCELTSRVTYLIGAHVIHRESRANKPRIDWRAYATSRKDKQELGIKTGRGKAAARNGDY